MAEVDTNLEAFRFFFGLSSFDMRTCSGESIYYLSVLYNRNFPPERNPIFSENKEPDGFQYKTEQLIYPDRVEIKIESTESLSEWDISICTLAGKVPLVKNSPQISVVNFYPYFCPASVEGENFEKLKNKSCIVICQMIRPKMPNTIKKTIFFTVGKNSKYLKLLEGNAKIHSSPGLTSSTMVSIRIGEETEIVRRDVLCLRSPVFANMFRHDMRERRENMVTITDITMPVLKAVVSFMYSQILQDCDFDFLCDLYYAADKYDVPRLKEACIRLLLPKVTQENIFQLLKLSLLHNDELLKSVVMTLISANIKIVVLTSGWETLMRDEPEIALKASTFFDL